MHTTAKLTAPTIDLLKYLGAFPEEELTSQDVFEQWSPGLQKHTIVSMVSNLRTAGLIKRPRFSQSLGSDTIRLTTAGLRLSAALLEAEQ